MTYTNGSGLTIAEVAAELFRRLGLRMLAELGGASSPTVAQAWTIGTGLPANEAPLRAALTAVRAIATAADDAAAYTWLTSRNAHLQMRPPLVALRNATTTDEFAQIIATAFRDVA